jgi:hypothetical protein
MAQPVGIILGLGFLGMDLKNFRQEKSKGGIERYIEIDMLKSLVHK